MHMKVDHKIFGWGWSKIDVANLITWLQNWLYLKNEQMEWTNVLHAGANLGKIKSNFSNFRVGEVKNGHGHLVNETLKSVVCQYFCLFPCPDVLLEWDH